MSKPQPPQVRLDLRVQVPGLGLLLPLLGGEVGHVLLEGLPVVLVGRRAHAAARREYVAVPPDLLRGCALAEAGDVGVALAHRPGWITAFAGMTPAPCAGAACGLG